MRTPLRSLAAFLTTLASCGGSALDLAELDAARQAANCARLVRCGLVASVSVCNEYFRAPPPNSYAAAEQAGHLSFDGEQAQRCMDALAAQSCDVAARDVRRVPAACTAMFRGRIADGDACASDEQCASARCEQGVCPEGVCCVGRCGETRPTGTVGSPCDRTSECADGFCSEARRCEALVALNGSCSRDEQCDYGLACLSASPSLPGACLPLPGAGEPCPYGRCGSIALTCDPSGRCKQLGLPGDACMTSRDCSSLAQCDVSAHRCVELPTLGMPCDVACAGESWCDFNGQAVGLCSAPVANGTPCDDGGKCLSQNCKPGPVFDSCEDYPICP